LEVICIWIWIQELFDGPQYEASSRITNPSWADAATWPLGRETGSQQATVGDD